VQSATCCIVCILEDSRISCVLDSLMVLDDELIRLDFSNTKSVCVTGSIEMDVLEPIASTKWDSRGTTFPVKPADVFRSHETY
jgi:hypothetical protein